MTLKKFTDQVNTLVQNNCDKINKSYREGKSLFGALPIKYPECLLRYYHKNGMSPKQALLLIEQEAAAEAYAESLIS